MTEKITVQIDDEIIVRDITPEEIANREQAILDEEALVSKSLAVESAISKLAKLGLTEEEARAIIGM